jgi:hypothetical protein
MPSTLAKETACLTILSAMNQTVRVTLVLAPWYPLPVRRAVPPRRPPVACLEPPADQVVDTGVLPMEVLPNPASSGTVVELITGEIRLPNAPVVGIGLDLQCWTDNGWTNLYRLTRDSLGEPTSIPYGTDVTFAEPDLGLSLPDQSRILVPDAAPGIYRIADAVVDSGRELPGFAYLEVVAP